MNNKEFKTAFDFIVKEKNIDPEVVKEAMQNALAAGYKKNTGEDADVRAEFNTENGMIRLFRRMTVVDEIEKCLESDRIKSLKDKNLFSDKCPLTIAITYDADMYKNIHVLQAGMKWCESLNARFPKVPVVYLLWDLNLGKGFDDMKYYCLDKGINYYDKCFVLDADMFNNYAQESIDNAIGRHKKKFGEMELACRIRTDEFKDFLYDELWRKRLAKHQH